MCNVFRIACIVPLLRKVVAFWGTYPILCVLRRTVWAIAVVLHGWGPWESEIPLSGNTSWFKAEHYSFHYSFLGALWYKVAHEGLPDAGVRCTPVGEGPTEIYSFIIQFCLVSINMVTHRILLWPCFYERKCHETLCPHTKYCVV